MTTTTAPHSRAKLYGRLIKEAREAEGMTQAALAQAVVNAAADDGERLSLTAAAVCRWEAGRFEPALRYRPFICEALGVRHQSGLFPPVPEGWG